MESNDAMVKMAARKSANPASALVDARRCGCYSDQVSERFCEISPRLVRERDFKRFRLCKLSRIDGNTRKALYNKSLEYFGAWRSLASASEWGSEGRKFKSCRPDIVKPVVARSYDGLFHAPVQPVDFQALLYAQ